MNNAEADDDEGEDVIESLLLNFCRQSLFIARGEPGKSILQEIVYGASL